MTIFNTAFDDVLSSLKVNGMCLLAEKYQSPWAISIPDGDQLRRAVGVTSSTRVFAFHLVKQGSFELKTNDISMTVGANEVVILTGSQDHVMGNGKTDKIIPLNELMNNRPAPINIDSAKITDLICGVFMLGNAQNNPLVSALPPIIHADVSEQKGDPSLHLLARLLAVQTGASGSQTGNMAARTLEMFCAQAFRLYVKENTSEKPNWFRGLNDDKIGAALNLIHTRPEFPWSVSLLANEVGMSASRFAARFRQTLDISPMRYVARWRMNIASRMLVETDQNTTVIAQKVGYESTPAFTRAFAKHYSAPPSRWRREQLLP